MKVDFSFEGRAACRLCILCMRKHYWFSIVNVFLITASQFALAASNIMSKQLIVTQFGVLMNKSNPVYNCETSNCEAVVNRG